MPVISSMQKYVTITQSRQENFHLLSPGHYIGLHSGGASGKESACQCRRFKKCGFDLWVGTISGSRKWQPTPVFLPENSTGRGAWWATVCGAAELDTTEHMGRGAFMMMSIVETNRAVQIYPMLLCGGKGIWSGAREGERIRKVKMAEEVQDQVYPSRDICKNESMCDQGQVNLI